MAPEGTPGQLSSLLEDVRAAQLSRAQQATAQARGDFDQAAYALRPLTPEAAARGASLRAALGDARDAVKRGVDEAWRPINQSRQPVDIGPLSDRFDRVTDDLSEALRRGSVPAEAGIPGELASIRPMHPLNEITGLRSALTDAQRGAAAAQTPKKARVAGQYIDALDDYMAKELPTDIQRDYANARRATSGLKARFERPGTGIGDVLARRQGGTPRVPDNAVLGRFVQSDQGRTPNLSALMREAGGDERVQSSVRDQILHNVQDAKLLEKPEVLNKWLADHKAVFEHFPEVRKEISGAAALQGKLGQAQNAESSLIKELTAPNGGPIARYLSYGDENAKQAMKSVLSAKSPAKAMDEILSFVKDDPEAVEGARKVFWDVLEDTAKSKGSTTATLDGIQPWIPGKLKNFLEDPRYTADCRTSLAVQPAAPETNPGDFQGSVRDRHPQPGKSAEHLRHGARDRRERGGYG